MEFRRLLFVLNPRSGASGNHYKEDISSYFIKYPQFDIKFYIIEWDKSPIETLKSLLSEKHFDAVIASGGDGTIRFVSKILYDTDNIMGILPTGSANGLAKNLRIPQNLQGSLDVIRNGNTQCVSSLSVNGLFCIHLADIGLNAAIVKRFENENARGIKGYFKALRTLYFKQKRVRSVIYLDGKKLHSSFYMLVFCNGTGYGTGLAINPNGRLDDTVFEVVRVKKLSIIEGLRLYWGKDKPSPDYVKICSCKIARVELSRHVHLQVDGEYVGKTNKIEAKINSKFISMMVPE